MGSSAASSISWKHEDKKFHTAIGKVEPCKDHSGSLFHACMMPSPDTIKNQLRPVETNGYSECVIYHRYAITDMPELQTRCTVVFMENTHHVSYLARRILNECTHHRGEAEAIPTVWNKVCVCAEEKTLVSPFLWESACLYVRQKTLVLMLLSPCGHESSTNHLNAVHRQAEWM